MMPSNLSRRQIATILSLLKAGHTTTAISRQTGIALETVNKARQAAGYPAARAYVRQSSTWLADALCRTPGAPKPEVWDADHTDHGPGATAAAWCARCPVRLACLTEQMAWEGAAGIGHRTGIWGGLSPNERLSLYRSGGRAGRAKASV